MLNLTSNHRSGFERATGQYLSKFIRSDENNANSQDLSCWKASKRYMHKGDYYSTICDDEKQNILNVC